MYPNRLSLFAMSICISVSLLISACARDEKVVDNNNTGKGKGAGFGGAVESAPYGWNVFLGEKYGEILDLVLASQLKQGEERRGFKVMSLTQGANTTKIELDAAEVKNIHGKYKQEREGKWTITRGADNKAEGSASQGRWGKLDLLEKGESSTGKTYFNFYDGFKGDPRGATLQVNLSNEGEGTVKWDSKGDMKISNEGKVGYMNYTLHIELQIKRSTNEIQILRSSAKLEINPTVSKGVEAETGRMIFTASAPGVILYKSDAKCPTLIGTVTVLQQKDGVNVATKSIVYAENSITVAEDNVAVPLASCETRPAVDYSRILGN